MGLSEGTKHRELTPQLTRVDSPSTDPRNLRTGQTVSPTTQWGQPTSSASWISVLIFYFKKGAFVEAINKWNNTPLQFTAMNGQTSMVELLLENGASIEAKR